MFALLNVFALHALVLALSVAWQAYIQHAPHLYITAAIALVFKAIVIPVALRRMVFRLGIHREIETVVGIGLTMLAGIGLVALSLMVMLPVTAHADPLAREDLAFALSVVLLGLLMMVTRRNAVSQVVGFMSLENGLILAATGAQGMPLVVEISVAFSVLIAFIVIGIFLFRIRERFDTVDVAGARPVPRGAAVSELGRCSWSPLVARCIPALAPRCSRCCRLPPRRRLNVVASLLTFLLRAAAAGRSAGRRAVPAGRRPQRRLHRAQHLRRLHHQRVQRQLYRPRAGDRPADADYLRFYHAMYQVMLFGMNLALLANNIGLMWVAVELATLTTVRDGRHLPHATRRSRRPGNTSSSAASASRSRCSAPSWSISRRDPWSARASMRWSGPC